MRLASYGDGYRLAVIAEDSVYDVQDALCLVPASHPQATMEAVITGFDSLKPEIDRAAKRARAQPLAGVRLRAPLPRPGKIMAMGTNYKEYVPGPPLPIWGFFKSPEAALDPGGTITLPPDDFVVCHHEAETVVVIGKRAERVSLDSAMDFVFGYMCGVDVSARYYGKPGQEQPNADLANTLLGKSYPGFAPMGPWITTRDEVPDPYALRMRLSVDGELRQDVGNDDMGHDIAECVSYFSARTPLNPGDVIFLGTNHQGLSPLQNGSHVDMEITGLGRLSFDITDPLKRTWPKGIDQGPGRNAIARMHAYHEQLARLGGEATA
jgi:2-keto-4-pentenoate hydratase/2-oxohepta-3-ene-1,7-dioic acid hydratase in catechol pathway